MLLNNEEWRARFFRFFDIVVKEGFEDVSVDAGVEVSPSPIAASEDLVDVSPVSGSDLLHDPSDACDTESILTSPVRTQNIVSPVVQSSPKKLNTQTLSDVESECDDERFWSDDSDATIPYDPATGKPAIPSRTHTRVESSRVLGDENPIDGVPSEDGFGVSHSPGLRKFSRLGGLRKFSRLGV